jgi:hypothetical protein
VGQSRLLSIGFGGRLPKQNLTANQGKAFLPQISQMKADC